VKELLRKKYLQTPSLSLTRQEANPDHAVFWPATQIISAQFVRYPAKCPVSKVFCHISNGRDFGAVYQSISQSVYLVTARTFSSRERLPLPL